MTGEADEHIIEAIGRCRIVIRDGKVVEVGEAQIRDCPLAKRFAYPIRDLNRESVKANIEHRISAFGMCTPEREVLGSEEFVGFGASEILSFGLSAGLVDAVVLACDGAGTVIVNNPSLVQGIGGRMSGLVKTTPYPDVIRRIEENGGLVTDKVHARLDQAAGVERAYGNGFHHVAVTVADPAEARQIRERYPDAIIFAVHVTGLSREDAETLISASDLVTACASGPIREIAGRKARVQAGVAIPVFAMTEKGKELIIEKIRKGKEPVLVKTTRLPAFGEQQPEPLV
jgi:putative methanogenesis marker protein 8